MAGKKTDYKTRDIFKYYKDNVIPALQSDYATFVKVISEYNKKVRDRILYESVGVKLPCRTGVLRVKKRKMTYTPNKMKPDWKATKELWERNSAAKEQKKLVYHMNEHRKGYEYNIQWDKTIMNTKGHSIYNFVPTRTFTRTLSHILKTRMDIDYYL